MGKNKKVGIIGHFGGGQKFYDGQTIKTLILYQELQQATDWEIIPVDTFYKKKNPARLIIDTFKCFISTKDVIVLLSRNGMRMYFPILFFMKKVFHLHVYHDVIGGNLDKYVEKYPKFRKYLNAFDINWVETEGLKKKLEAEGVINCQVIPNFKRLQFTEQENCKYEEPYRFCMFSRVMKEKGVEDAISAIESINKENGRVLCRLDIYGQIDEGYKAEFQEVLDKASDAVAYKGIVPYDQSVNVIRQYYALLFPTYWDGEGFPGTIVDAFSAGVPVIATDWNCNGEIVKNGVNGILYPSDEIDTLENAIKWLCNNSNCMDKLKTQCISDAENYKPDNYIQTMIKTILE